MSSSRKHLNPAVSAEPGLHPTRRAGGARRELSERVVFRGEGVEVDGWALNASRSGLRAILEEVVKLGSEYEITVGEAPSRPGRVVWMQEEKDGAIVGVSYLDEAARMGSIPDIQVATPPPPVASQRAQTRREGRGAPPSSPNAAGTPSDPAGGRGDGSDGGSTK